MPDTNMTPQAGYAAQTQCTKQHSDKVTVTQEETRPQGRQCCVGYKSRATKQAGLQLPALQPSTNVVIVSKAEVDLQEQKTLVRAGDQ